VLLQGSSATLAVDGVSVAAGRLPPRTARIAYAGMLLLAQTVELLRAVLLSPRTIRRAATSLPPVSTAYGPSLAFADCML
jgi:hypothetical protein